MYELITIDVSGSTVNGLGCKTYEYMPRKGDWVELDIDDTGTMYEVVVVAHSSTGAGSDIYIRLVGDTSSALGSLCSS